MIDLKPGLLRAPGGCPPDEPTPWPLVLTLVARFLKMARVRARAPATSRGVSFPPALLPNASSGRGKLDPSPRSRSLSLRDRGRFFESNVGEVRFLPKSCQDNSGFFQATRAWPEAL